MNDFIKPKVFDDSKYYTQHLEKSYAEVLSGLVLKRPKDIPDYLENSLHFLLLCYLWEEEAETRLEDGEPKVTQVGFFHLTRSIQTYAEFLGVYVPHLWQFFCSVTENPRAIDIDQNPISPDPSTRQIIDLASGDLYRLHTKHFLKHDQPPEQPFPEDKQGRYKSPPCKECGSTNTFVMSTRKNHRHLCCRKCNYHWKRSRKNA